MKALLFSVPMVGALRRYIKDVTRRLVDPQPVVDQDSGYVYDGNFNTQYDIHDWKQRFCADHAQVGEVYYLKSVKVY